MRTSISTTSGRSSPARADRLAAVGGLADDLDVGLGVEDHPEAGAHERLVVGEQDADHRARPRRSGRPRADREAAAGRGPASSCRRRARRARACREAVAAPVAAARRRRRRRRRPRARARRASSARSTRRARPPGVLERVGERLLHDPVGGKVDARRQLAPLALDADVDRQAGLAHVLDQPSSAAARLRRECGCASSSRSRPSSRRISASACAPVRSTARAAARPSGRARAAAARRRPARHHRDAVRDHVVQLAGDARPAPRDRGARQLALLGSSHGARAEPPLALSAQADQQTREPDGPPMMNAPNAMSPGWNAVAVVGLRSLAMHHRQR